MADAMTGACASGAVEAPSASVVAQAADWMVRIQAGADEQERAACARWRTADPTHELAWQRLWGMGAELAGTDSPIGEIPVHTLHRLYARNHRRSHIAWMVTLAGSGLLGWRMAADRPLAAAWATYRTGTGEIRRLMLADGTRLVLDTDTALDVDFNDRVRHLRLLHGEILVETAVDAMHRPMHVTTSHGVVQPIGTRFIVGYLSAGNDGTAVSVLQGQVRVRPRHAVSDELLLAAGQRAVFNERSVTTVGPLPVGADAWVDGMVVANQMQLGDLAAELGRYRPGWLRCDPRVAHLRVTGTFPITDTDHALRLLSQVLPVRILTRGPYWVTLSAREDL